ncbi:MAG TPA: hypothetical protein VI564_05030 [Candidatus Nanoarchaeia archaeon]|nr:hypothetical protein [Candidatus Nanoarchaeia archaeon]
MNVDCPDIEEARQQAYAEYDANLRKIADVYLEARRAFEAELNECVKGLWQGHPCDEEWNNVQQAYEQASAEISNDEFYNNYKQASQKWKDCHAQFDNHLEDWMEQNRKKEEACQQQFKAKVDAAQDAYYKAQGDAKAIRDAKLNALAELERKCREDAEKKKKEIKTGGGGTETTDGQTDGTDTTDDEDDETEEEVPVEPKPNSAACARPVTQERTKKAPDLGPKDVLTNVMVQAAEEVTGTVIPTSAINEKIFAVFVVARLQSRIAELEIEESDAQLSGQRSKEIRIRRQLARYRQAIQLWGKIAEGRPPADIGQQAQQLDDLPPGTCQSDAECGEPVCCSKTSVGNWHCDTAKGTCYNSVDNCAQNEFCGGSPVRCIKYEVPKKPAVKVGNDAVPTMSAIRYGSDDFILISELHKFKGDDKEECDAEEHWHGNIPAVKTVYNKVAYDPGGCGFGKTRDVRVMQIKKVGDKYEVA